MTPDLDLFAAMNNEPHESAPGFRPVPRTGVIYVMHRAAERGFRYDNPQWANLGQGAPEVGPIAGEPERISAITIDPRHHEYAPITGQQELREAVARLYNALYRQGKSSQYTSENVSISGGGRVALTRVAAALGNINMGHFLPDYTAYEELLSVFKAFIPIPILLDAESGYRVPLGQLKKDILGLGLKALLASNPTNPTGQVIEGNQLAALVGLARDYQCSLILDEFYSHFIYTGPRDGSPRTISAAAYVQDVNQDPVILIDGLTKNWRYPGWRISWTLGPKKVINAIASAGSFLDGGANNPLQGNLAPLLQPEYVAHKNSAMQRLFRDKRDYTLKRLRQMGILVDVEPEGTFYVWANLSKLPSGLNDGMAFFEAGLTEHVITVPGIFFDVNPDKRRGYGRYQNYCRISFGPEFEVLRQGLDALERVICPAPTR